MKTALKEAAIPFVIISFITIIGGCFGLGLGVGFVHIVKQNVVIAIVPMDEVKK